MTIPVSAKNLSDKYLEMILENLLKQDECPQGQDIVKEVVLKFGSCIHQILELFPYVVWVKNADGEFVSGNCAFLKLVGLNEVSDLVGKNDFDVWPKHFADIYAKDDRMFFADNCQKEKEEFYPCGSEYLCFEVTKKPIYDKNGRIVAYVAFGRDITWRHEMEKKCRDSETAYRSLAENLPGAVYRISYGEPHKVKFFNNYFQQITGYEPEELAIGKYCSWENIVDPKDRKKFFQKFKKSIEN